MNAHRTGKALNLAMVSVVVLAFVVTGCQTCPPGDPVTVTIEKRVLVPAPEIEREDVPQITSGCAEGEDPAGPCWSEAEAAADPAGWQEAILSDLAAWVNSWFEYDDKVAASNSTRPPTE